MLVAPGTLSGRPLGRGRVADVKNQSAVVSRAFAAAAAAAASLCKSSRALTAAIRRSAGIDCNGSTLSNLVEEEDEDEEDFSLRVLLRRDTVDARQEDDRNDGSSV
jgi:hypothetical protein